MTNDQPLGAKTAPTVDDDTPRDEPLAAPVVSQEDAELGIEDVAHDIAPEDFDFATFVEGARPARRRVTISTREDLIAEMERIVTLIERAETAGESIDDLVGEYEQVRATYEAGRRPIIVEARSTEWLRKVEKDAKKRHKLDPNKPEDAATIMLRQIAGQIVHPTNGVTVPALRTLLENAEPQIDKIFRACQSANRAGGGVAPDFSRSPSGRTRNG